MSLILNSNQFQIVRRKDFPFRVVYLHSKGFSGAFVQNLKTFLAAGEEMTFTPLAQSNDDREQLPAYYFLFADNPGVSPPEVEPGGLPESDLLNLSDVCVAIMVF